MIINMKLGDVLEIHAVEQVSIPRVKLNGQMLWESWRREDLPTHLPPWDKVDSVVQKRYDEWANCLNRQLFGDTFGDYLAAALKGI